MTGPLKIIHSGPGEITVEVDTRSTREREADAERERLAQNVRAVARWRQATGGAP